MLRTLLVLIASAALEIGGDAAIRIGLRSGAGSRLALGAVLLVAYGLVVNTDRSLDFGRLMGTYIAVFFVVAQVVGLALFGETPSGAVLIGGMLIVVGGLVIQVGGG